MTIDPYSLCPGGSGKKVKFCCGDLLDDLNRLEKMVEGEQYTAALEQIDSLLETHALNDSLLALRTRLLRLLGRFDEAKAAAAAFLDAHPKNPVALAESAVLTAAEGDGRGGMAKLQQALAVSKEELYGRVYNAMGAVADALFLQGEIRACRALLQLQVVIAKKDPQPLELLVRINGSASIPLLLKEDRPLARCPAGAAWKPRFDEAMVPMQQGCWAEMVRRLAALAVDQPGEPSIWQNLAMVRQWLADADGSVEALRNLAVLDIPRDDAVEAEALALLLSKDGFGDDEEIFDLEYEVKDIDPFAAGFSTCKRAEQVAIDYEPLDENDVPPKSAFVLLDRPIVESLEGLEPGDIPTVIGHAMLFGRQTDRPARLSIADVPSRSIGAIESLVAELGSEQLAGKPRQEAQGRRSAMQYIFSKAWHLPQNATPEQIHDLVETHAQHAIMEQWPAMSLGCLGGKTPRQAAADAGLANWVLALILILETAIDVSAGDFDYNRLRAEMGLPQAEPIDPQTAKQDEQNENAARSIVATLPLVRLARVEVAKLCDEFLMEGYRRAAAFYAVRAMRKFGEEVLQRPSFKGKDEESEVLYQLSRLETDADKRLEYIDRGRKNTVAAGKSCAVWDLLELPMRIERREPEEMGRLLDHMQKKHSKEPGVVQAVAELFAQIGALRPRGTPAEIGDAAEGPLEATAGAQAGRLWTPDGGSGGEDKPSLWVPGMD